MILGSNLLLRMERAGSGNGWVYRVSFTANDSFGGNCTGTVAVDPDGDTITLTQSPAGPYSLGNTSVTLIVIDDKGASASCSAMVTVVDTTVLIISSVSASPNVLWPPNHKMVPVTVGVSVADVCDHGASSRCQITSVTSNEPINGLGDGDTAPDWVITGNLTVDLRAERSGTSSGREYAIVVKCTDASGNSSTKTGMVVIPHDRGK